MNLSLWNPCFLFTTPRYYLNHNLKDSCVFFFFFFCFFFILLYAFLDLKINDYILLNFILFIYLLFLTGPQGQQCYTLMGFNPV